MAAVVAKREGPPFISEAAVRGNAAVLDYCRTSVSALSGATAGILGLTGLYGFIFYLLASILLSLLLILKAGRRWNKYFKSRRPLFTGVSSEASSPTSCSGHSSTAWCVY
uniref:ER membrane protein complex subunit 6 n=1 Tax=Bos mutus grunniens TaxID=30521 RepID=A0A8B9Y8N5_BOSMU